MQLTIGSIRLPGSDGTINIRGKPQIALEWGPMDAELLLTMDLYGVGGRRLARLRRNQWTFNDKDRFDFRGTVGGFNLVDTVSSQIIFGARVMGRDSVVITHGAFYSSAGHEIEIANEDWKGVTDSRTSLEPATQSTNPPFARDEVASIRRSVASSSDTVACPRCGCPLTRERRATEGQRDSWLVSCMICRRNLVVRAQS